MDQKISGVLFLLIQKSSTSIKVGFDVCREVLLIWDVTAFLELDEALIDGTQNIPNCSMLWKASSIANQNTRQNDFSHNITAGGSYLPLTPKRAVISVSRSSTIFKTKPRFLTFGKIFGIIFLWKWLRGWYFPFLQNDKRDSTCGCPNFLCSVISVPRPSLFLCYWISFVQAERSCHSSLSSPRRRSRSSVSSWQGCYAPRVFAE